MEKLSPLAETREALGPLQKMGRCIYGVQGVTSQKLKTQLSCRQTCASCHPFTARPWNYTISNTKNRHSGGSKDLWYLTDSLGRHFTFQPNLRSNFYSPQETGSIYCLSLSFQNARAPPKQSDRWPFRCKTNHFCSYTLVETALQSKPHKEPAAGGWCQLHPWASAGDWLCMPGSTLWDGSTSAARRQQEDAAPLRYQRASAVTCPDTLCRDKPRRKSLLTIIIPSVK